MSSSASRTSFFVMLLLASGLSTPALSGKETPITTCSEAWREQHATRTNVDFQARVVEARDALDALSSLVLAQGGQVTQRSVSGSVYEIRANVGRPIAILPTLQAYDAQIDRQSENDNPLNVEQQCNQLRANQNVAERLESWLSEADSVEEKALVTSMMTQHLRTITSLDGQLRAIEVQPRQTVRVRLTQLPRPTEQARE